MRPVTSRGSAAVWIQNDHLPEPRGPSWTLRRWGAFTWWRKRETSLDFRPKQRNRPYLQPLLLQWRRGGQTEARGRRTDKTTQYRWMEEEENIQDQPAATQSMMGKQSEQWWLQHREAWRRWRAGCGLRGRLSRNKALLFLIGLETSLQS